MAPHAVGQGRQDVAVLGWAGHDRDAAVVLRGGARHRGPADVDLLDALHGRRPGRDGLLERVQVGHEQLERRDPEFRQLG